MPNKYIKLNVILNIKIFVTRFTTHKNFVHTCVLRDFYGHCPGGEDSYNQYDQVQSATQWVVTPK